MYNIDLKSDPMRQTLEIRPQTKDSTLVNKNNHRKDGSRPPVRTTGNGR